MEQTTKTKMPMGGTTKPTPKEATLINAKCKVSIPKDLATGNKMGTKSKSAGIPSKRAPKSKKTRFAVIKKTKGLLENPMIKSAT
jgi:hypothetical protein